MKKIFLFLALLTVFTLPSLAETIEFSQWDNIKSQWTTSGTVAKQSYKNQSSIQLQSNASIISPAFKQNLETFTVNIARSNNGTTFTISFSYDKKSWTQLKQINSNDISSGNWKVYSLDLSSIDKSKEVYFKFESAKASYYIESIAYFYGESNPVNPELGDANLAWNPAEGASVTLEDESTWTFPTLSKDTDGEVTYTSSNPEVATIDAATGKITLLKKGTTEITATTPPTDTYNAGTAKYTLTVTSNVVEPIKEIVFDFTSKNTDSVFTQDGVTLTFLQNGNSNSKPTNNYQHLRFYANNKLEIKSDAEIESVKFEYVSGKEMPKDKAKVSTGEYNYSTHVWTLSGTSANLINTNSAQVQFTKIIVTVVNDGKKDAVLKWMQGSEDVTGKTVEFDVNTPESEWVKPVLTMETDGEVTYTSSNESVAMYEDGTWLFDTDVLGEATITAAAAAGETYKAGEAKVTVKLIRNLADPELKFSADAVTFDKNEEADGEMIEADKLPVLSKAEGVPAATYTSSNKEIADIEEDGSVLYLYKKGEVTITAKTAGTETYNPGEATYKVTVTDSTPVEGYVLVTDIRDLKIGDEIVFVGYNESGKKWNAAKTYSGSDKYISAIENVTVENNVLPMEDDYQVLTVAKGNDSDYTYSFKQGSQYMICDGKTNISFANEYTDFGGFNIEIAKDGAATITSYRYVSNSNPRHYLLRYNASAPRFTTYESGQNEIYIFRKPRAEQEVANIHDYKDYTNFAGDASKTTFAFSTNLYPVKKAGTTLYVTDAIETHRDKNRSYGIRLENVPEEIMNGIRLDGDVTVGADGKVDGPRTYFLKNVTGKYMANDNGFAVLDFQGGELEWMEEYGLDAVVFDDMSEFDPAVHIYSLVNFPNATYDGTYIKTYTAPSQGAMKRAAGLTQIKVQHDEANAVLNESHVGVAKSITGLVEHDGSDFVMIPTAVGDHMTGVEGVELDAESVMVIDGNIVAPEGAEVYGVNGVRVSGEGLAKGVYVVRMGKKAVKVMVR